MRRYIILFSVILMMAGCVNEFPGPETEEQASPELTVIRATIEDPGTKTRLDMNAAGTHAKVLWTAGDQIKVIGATASGFYANTFSTADDGTVSADFACDSWNPSSTVAGYYAFYPESRFRGYISNGLGVHIPGTQTAKAGGVQEGMNMAYAYATSMSDGLLFKNIPALIRFRLSGGAVSALASVRLSGTTILTGDIVITDLSAGDPTYAKTTYIPPREEDGNTFVELQGPFTAGIDYYMAVFPGTTNGFSMTFTSGTGEYIVKQSTKTLTLNRSRITDFGTIDIGDAYGDPLVTKYMTATAGSRPVNLVVMPDGFTAAQRADFESLAASGMDFLFNTEPYKTYRNYFNVYFIWKESAEAGASVCDAYGNITTARNTAFGSYWEADAYDMMAADEDAVFAYAQAHCPEIIRGETDVTEVPVLLIINDSRYGGKAHLYSSGKTYCQVPYTDNGGTLNWPYPGLVAASDDPADGYVTKTLTSAQAAELYGAVTGDWRNTLVHEFGGHSFGRLADEYWYESTVGSQSDIAGHSWPVPYGLNVSGWYDDSRIPWKDLLDRRASLVSANPLYARIGKFQGGNVSVFNRWRCEEVSCMIDNRPYFSAWQRVLIAKRILGLAGETFSLNAHLSVDVPEDPVRDVVSSPVILPSTKAPATLRPMLPPPELIDDRR